MNFGHKIAFVYIGFVVFILTLVGLCLTQKDIFLVSKDYYAKEVAYQSEINKAHNAAKLSVPVALNYASEVQQLVLSFPAEMQGASGQVEFYRPSDAAQDFRLSLALNTNNQYSIPVKRLSRGLWVVKIDWQKGGKFYYKEEKISL
jgi:nitrogen fixation protein FixH